jgi:hypothetical protein
LAIGRWLYPSDAILARRRGEQLRELERPEHDHRRARQIAEIQSELSRLKGWTPTGP